MMPRGRNGRRASAAASGTPIGQGRSQRLPLSFSFLLSGETISLFGSQVTAVLLPLVAVLVLDANKLVMGLLAAAGWAPVVIFGLVAGIIVDRHDTRRILICCNVVCVLALGTIPLLAWRDLLSIPVLVIVALVVGTAYVFFNIAFQTFVPDIVATDQLESANSRLELCRSTAQLLGPLAGGTLATAINPAYGLLIDAASYILATLTLLMVPRPARAASRPRATVAEGGSLITSLKEGQRLVWRSRSLRLVVITGSSINIFIAGITALLVLYITRTLDLSAGFVGLALAVEGGGALLGALAYPRIAEKIGESGCIRFGIISMAVGGMLLPFAGLGVASVACVLVSRVFSGFGSPVVNIALVTLRQRITPPELLGRVNATARVGIMSSLPLGALLFGAVAQATSVQDALWFAASGQIIVVMVLGSRVARIRNFAVGASDDA